MSPIGIVPTLDRPLGSGSQGTLNFFVEKEPWTQSTSFQVLPPCGGDPQ